MIESKIRQRLSNLQTIYDYMPYSIQNLLTTIRGIPLAKMRYQKLFWKCLENLINRENWSSGEMENYQNEKFRSLLKYCYENVPFYYEVFKEKNLKPDDFKNIYDLKKLPIITREKLYNNWNKFISTSVSDGKKIKVFTSGTSGSGLPVVYDEIALVKNWAFRARQKIWANSNPREWRISLYGSKIVPFKRKRPPYWTYNYLEKQILMSIFHLSENNKKHYINFLKSHKNLLLEGFPTVLFTLSGFLTEEGIRMPMKAVFTDGEPLYSYMRDRIKSAFTSDIYDHYGMTEWVGLIQECEKGKHHLISDYGILEILDEESNPVSQDEEGYFVWTGLTNSVMPLIRYRIGDKGMWSKERKCQCGRPFPLVNPTITRESDNIISQDGRILSPRAINQVLKNKTAFKSCQFIQKRIDFIIIRIVPRNSNYFKEAEKVKSELMKILGKTINISIKKAERVIQYDSGKIPLIISKLKVSNE